MQYEVKYLRHIVTKVKVTLRSDWTRSLGDEWELEIENWRTITLVLIGLFLSLSLYSDVTGNTRNDLFIEPMKADVLDDRSRNR